MIINYNVKIPNLHHLNDTKKNEVKNYLIRVRDYTQSLVNDLNTNIADLEAKIEAANTTPVEGESING